MAFYIKKTINGVPKGIPLTTDSGQGLPLGAWTSFEDDQPRNGYLKAGTTFNQADYPALYNMLGTNVVPERFDHNRISEQETIVNYTNEFVISSKFPFTALYDGFYSLLIYTTTSERQVTVNGVNVGKPMGSHTSSIEIFANKGDIINITGGGNLGSFAFYATYYKHPMFIKAVIGPIEDSAADQVVQNINNSRSYSTSEVNTGKKWIDGKPIYSRSYICTTQVSVSSNWVNVQGWNYSNDYGFDEITLTSVDFGQFNNCLLTYPRADLWGKFLTSNSNIATYVTVGSVMTIYFTKTTD